MSSAESKYRTMLKNFFHNWTNCYWNGLNLRSVYKKNNRKFRFLKKYSIISSHKESHSYARFLQIPKEPLEIWDSFWFFQQWVQHPQMSRQVRAVHYPFYTTIRKFQVSRVFHYYFINCFAKPCIFAYPHHLISNLPNWHDRNM